MPKFQIPGTAWQRAEDGQYPIEEEARWHRLSAASWERSYGRGPQKYGGDRRFARVFMVETAQEREDLADLREYLDSCAGAAWAALPDQRGDLDAYSSVRREAEACTLACQRITAALGDDWKPAP